MRPFDKEDLQRPQLSRTYGLTPQPRKSQTSSDRHVALFPLAVLGQKGTNRVRTRIFLRFRPVVPLSVARLGTKRLLGHNNPPVTMVLETYG